VTRTERATLTLPKGREGGGVEATTKNVWGIADFTERVSEYKRKKGRPSRKDVLMGKKGKPHRERRGVQKRYVFDLVSTIGGRLRHREKKKKHKDFHMRARKKTAGHSCTSFNKETQGARGVNQK